jgi:site-specific recombinase XerC
LATSGVVAPTTLPEPAPVAPRVGLFQDWLRHHRGLSERTIDRYGRMVMRLLAALGADPAVYEAGSIRQVILTQLPQFGPKSVALSAH